MTSVKPIDVSIIVPTFNRSHWLGEALKSLANQAVGDTLTYEIIVADNNSTDATEQVVRAFASTTEVPTTYVRETARGDAQARNAGLAQARGKWFAFFDDDQFAPETWLVELVRCARMTQAAVVGGPVFLAIDDRQRQAMGRICREFMREIDLSDEIIEYRGKQLPGTGNALVRADVMKVLGGFSLDFPSGGSDSDFFLRVRAAGHRMIYTPKAPIRHRVDERRLDPAYMRWEALSSGATHCARFDYENGGLSRLLSRCLARVGQAALINLPLYWKARLTGRSDEAIGRRLLLWRCEGYVRKTISVLMPKRFPQVDFFRWLELQNGPLSASGA